MNAILDEWHLPVRHLGQRVLVFDSLPSTNNCAALQADGTIVIAREQTSGRGQFGRSWHSPPGGVWLSVVFSPPEALRQPAILTAWAAVSVAETMQALIGQQPIIKWPNDVLVGGKKVCGVLIEQGRRTIAGIGLNVNQTTEDFVAANLPGATSLAMVAECSFSIEDVSRQLIERLDREYDALLRGEVAALETRWRRGLNLLGHPVQIELVNGQRIQTQLHELTFSQLAIIDDQGVKYLRPEEIRHIAAIDDS